MASKKNNSSTKPSSSKVKKSQTKSKTLESTKSTPKITPQEAKSYTASAKSPVTITPNPLVAAWSNPDFVRRFWAVVVGLAFVGVFIAFAFYYIPVQVLPNTNDAILARDKAKQEADAKKTQEEADKKTADENSTLKFTNQKVSIQTNFGEIKVSLKDQAAPKTVESFIRLAYRDYYNNIKFHRMVTGPNFSVLQGGDPKGDGSGGASAFGSTLPDELWDVKPTFATGGDTAGQITNEPKFRDASLYQDFDTKTGQVTYRKGLLVMAKTQAPDSAGSQFFITLDKTVLPAEYTAFGVVEDESIVTLDKIIAEVKPVPSKDPSTQGGVADGKPDKDIIIESVKIL